MLDSFNAPTAYRTEFTPWPVSATPPPARNARGPVSFPGEFTVHQRCFHEHTSDWPENFNCVGLH